LTYKRDFYILPSSKRGFLSNSILNPDFAVGIVARRRKPWRNVQLEQFYDEGISIDMLRSKIVKQALQQGFESTNVLSGRLI
jgi:hypothetical protein